MRRRPYARSMSRDAPPTNSLGATAPRAGAGDAPFPSSCGNPYMDKADADDFSRPEASEYVLHEPSKNCGVVGKGKTFRHGSEGCIVRRPPGFDLTTRLHAFRRNVGQSGPAPPLKRFEVNSRKKTGAFGV